MKKIFIIIVFALIGNIANAQNYLYYSHHNVYEEKMKHLPHPGAIVKTDDGEGVVDSVEVLKEIIKVKQ